MSKTNPGVGAGKRRMTMADLVRGQGPKHQKASPENPSRLIRLVRPTEPTPPAESAPPRTLDGGAIRATTDGAPARSDALGSEDLAASHDAFRSAVEAMEEVLKAARAGTSLSVSSLEAPLEALLASLQTSDLLLLPFFTPRGGGVDPAERAVNISVLAMKIATQLNFDHDALLRLGLAAVLHGGGVGRSHKDEAVRVHGLGARYAGVSEALVLLRERGAQASDAGSTEVRELAHIVRLADLSEGLVRRKPVKPGLGYSEAIKEILKHERGTYPDKILKALIRVLATLPVGSLVRLNTDEICRVVAKNDGFPLRPTVMVLVRHRKRVAEPTAIDLSQHPFLHIQGFVTEEMLDREATGGTP